VSQPSDLHRYQPDYPLGKALAVGALMHLLLFGTAWWVNPSSEELPMGVAFGVLVAIGAARALIGLTQARFYPARRKLWQHLNFVTSLLAALFWSVVTYSALGSTEYFTSGLIFVTITIGLSAGALISLYPHFPLMVAYTFTLIAPLVFRLLQMDHPVATGTAVCSICFFVFRLVQGRRANRDFWMHQELKISAEERNHTLSAVLDAIPGYVSWLTQDLRYIGGNTSFLQAFQLTSETLAGRNVGSISNDDRFHAELVDFQRSIDPSRLVEHSVSTNKGQRWMLLALQKFKLGDRPSIMVVGVDIHPMKEAQNELERSRLQSLHAAKMITLGHMAGSVAHEINNPLAIISSRAEQGMLILEHEPIERQRIEAILVRIRETTVRIAGIIRALRNLSRDASSDPIEKTSARDLILKSVEIGRTKFQSMGTQIRLSLPDPDIELECRSVELIQAFSSLLQFVHDGLNPAEPRWISISAEDAGNGIRVTLKDSGNSIPPNLDVAARDFSLSLHLAQAVLGAHGGELRIESHLGKTQFVFELPKRQELKSRAA
jgi:C4-dicarboxylate-specific signal transduction histidine kinase